MATPEHHTHGVHLSRFTVLAPVPPFVDLIIQWFPISPQDFLKITQLMASYPDDPRMIEMVRKAGDGSAKVPYLMEYGETAQSILEALREVATPHVKSLQKLPEPMQATIHTLLSINMIPRGCEAYGLPALLEIARVQKEMTQTLKGMMAGRKLAQEFHEENVNALKSLDEHWHNLRGNLMSWLLAQSQPEHSQMQFVPSYYRNSLVALREVCVIVDSPNARALKNLTPRVLQNPLPDGEMLPATGSEDWLLRTVGKVGRHFTRALLDIVAKHLEEERIQPGPQNYDRINFEAQDALRRFVESNP